MPPEALLSQEHHTTQPLVAELENVARSALRTPLPEAFATNEHILGEAEPPLVELVSRSGAAGVESKENLVEGGRIECSRESFEAFDVTPGPTTLAVALLAGKGRRLLLIVGSGVALPFAVRGPGLLRCRHPYFWSRWTGWGRRSQEGFFRDGGDRRSVRRWFRDWCWDIWGDWDGDWKREGRIRVIVVNECHRAHKDVEGKGDRCLKGRLIDWLHQWLSARSR